MRIGELATHLQLNPKTIRYYEEIGLLHKAERSSSGYRDFGEQDIERLRFIRQAKLLGFSLDEIREILLTRDTNALPCDQVFARTSEKIRAIDQRIADLVAFRSQMMNLRANWRDAERLLSSDAFICPIIELQTDVEEHVEAKEPLTPRRAFEE